MDVAFAGAYGRCIFADGTEDDGSNSRVSHGCDVEIALSQRLDEE